MKIILLAAGRGSRLGKRTESKPKCLNTFNGLSLLEHSINVFRECKLSDITIVGGYRSDMLTQFGVNVIVNTNWDTSGIFRSILTADEILSSNDSIVSYTDLVFSRSFIDACIESPKDIFVPSNKFFLDSWAKRNVAIQEDLETFAAMKGRLVDIGGKVEQIHSVEGQFAGLIKLSAKGWEDLKNIGLTISDDYLDTTSLLRSAIKAGIEISTSSVEGFWREFDNPDDFY